jgi:ferredoxin
MDLIPIKVSMLSIYVLFGLLLLASDITVTRFCNAFQSMKVPHSLPHHDSRTGSTKCMGPQTQTTRNFLSSQNDPVEDSNKIDVSVDERLYRVRISRAPGIDWGTDLSFSFVYVREMDPTGQASLLGMINKNDQLCEMIPVTTKPKDNAANAKPINLLGASFDFVMTSFASLDRTVSEMDLVFFRGNKQELKALCNGEAVKSEVETVTITVIQNKGSPQEELKRLQAPVGVNVRQYLVDNGINVYQSLTRWTNCKGKQLCGTCIVNVADGIPNTNWKSMDEASTLRSNPDSYRLSCVTFAHGDITVETFPPVNADQWTR